MRRDQGYVEFLETYAAMVIERPDDTLSIHVFGFARDITMYLPEPDESVFRIVTLFERPMILFNAVVQVLGGAVHDRKPRNGLNGLGIRGVLVGCHSVGLGADRVHRVAEKGFSRVQVSRSTQVHINEVPIAVDSPI